MRRDEAVGAGDALADVAELISDLTRDVHRAVADRAFRAVRLGTGPAATPVRAIHDAVAASVHAGVRFGVASALRGAGRLAAKLHRRPPAASPTSAAAARSSGC